MASESLNAMVRAERRARYHHVARDAVGKRVLDLSATSIEETAILHDAGAAHVVKVARSANQRQPAGVTTVVGDSRNVPIRSDWADIVVCFGLMEADACTSGVIKEAARTVSPGGSVYFSAYSVIRTASSRSRSWLRRFSRVTADSLHDLLACHFAQIEMRSQIPDTAFQSSPSWLSTSERELRPSEQLSRFVWSLADLTPLAVKDRFTRLLWNKGFFPTEYNFEFPTIDTAVDHAFVAACKDPI
jgi:SAM-dependent methyltransferase